MTRACLVRVLYFMLTAGAMAERPERPADENSSDHQQSDTSTPVDQEVQDVDDKAPVLQHVTPHGPVDQEDQGVDDKTSSVLQHASVHGVNGSTDNNKDHDRPSQNPKDDSNQDTIKNGPKELEQQLVEARDIVKDVAQNHKSELVNNAGEAQTAAHQVSASIDDQNKRMEVMAKKVNEVHAQMREVTAEMINELKVAEGARTGPPKKTEKALQEYDVEQLKKDDDLKMAAAQKESDHNHRQLLRIAGDAAPEVGDEA